MFENLFFRKIQYLWKEYLNKDNRNRQGILKSNFWKIESESAEIYVQGEMDG